MSHCLRPIDAAKIAVSAPMSTTTSCATGASEKSTLLRAIEIDARRHHRRRVDERGDGRRTGHGVGQPDVERDLRALAGAAEEQEETDRRDDRAAERRATSPPRCTPMKSSVPMFANIRNIATGSRNRRCG